MALPIDLSIGIYLAISRPWFSLSVCRQVRVFGGSVAVRCWPRMNIHGFVFVLAGTLVDAWLREK